MENEWSNRLNESLQLKGWTQTELSRRSGLNYASVNKYFTGGVEKPRGNTLKKLAEALEVEYLWLLDGINPETTIPVMGYVGAGQQIFSVSDGEIDRVDAPPNSKATSIDAIVRGDSATPIYEPGTILYYSETRSPIEMLNRRAICQLTDGRIMLKTVRNGTEAGKFTLQSINLSYPDAINVTLDWAAPIDWIKPRY